DEVGSWLAGSKVDGEAVTVGTLLSDDARFGYALRWRLADAGKAVVHEVLPLSGTDRRLIVPVDQLPPAVEARLRRPPRPRPLPSGGAGLLWEGGVHGPGLPRVAPWPSGGVP